MRRRAIVAAVLAAFAASRLWARTAAEDSRGEVSVSPPAALPPLALALNPAPTAARPAPLSSPAPSGPASGVDFSGVAAHMFEPARLNNRKNGIHGAHGEAQFQAALTGQGRMTGRDQVPGLPGVAVIRYQLYAMDRGVLTEQPKQNIFKKMVFDESRWDEQKLRALAQEIFDGAIGDGPVRATRGGVSFTGSVRDGKLQSFGAELSPEAVH